VDSIKELSDFVGILKRMEGPSYSLGEYHFDKMTLGEHDFEKMTLDGKMTLGEKIPLGGRDKRA